MNIIETIRAEVERLMDKANEGDGSEYFNGAKHTLISLLDFLDTLEEEPVDLEKEINEQWGSYTHDGHSAGIDRDEFNAIAYYFYELGETRMKEQMMQEAVEGRVCAVYPLKDGNDVQYGVLYPKGVLPYKDGQKVKLIIVKED